MAASRAVAAFLIDRSTRGDDRPIRVLSVPCGIPRELADAADAVRTHLGASPARVEFHGIDLDPDVLAEACAFARDRGLPRFHAHQGDALSRATYPVTFDCITCTGLGEFLEDDELAQLYGIFFDVLEPDGLLITSAMLSRRASDYLLRLAELRTHYRGPRDLERLVTRRPFRDVHVEMDAHGLQSILTARK
jgi:chemotaxis methyl-accepting protein methylase